MLSPCSQQRLTYFTFLWALLAYVEIVRYGEQWFLTLTGFVFTVAMMIALCRPAAVFVLPFLALTGFIHIFCTNESILSNLPIESLVNFSILVIFAHTHFRQTNQIPIHEVAYQNLAPVLRIYLIGIFFFAVLTKLNKDFLNPEVSCVGRIWDSLYYGYPSLFGFKTFMTLKPWVIKAALILEALLFSLLLCSKTRRLGIVMGLLFLLFLGWVPWTGIGSMITLTVILYFVFLSDREFSHLHTLGSKTQSIIKRALPSSLVRDFLIVGIVIASLAYDFTFVSDDFNYRRRIITFILTLMIMVYLIALWQTSRQQADNQPASSEMKTRLLTRPPVFSLLALMAIFYLGFSPFLGLRTRGYINMFTNLQVLGPRSNHLFIPSTLIIYKPKLVQIIDSNHPSFKYYVNYRYLITDYEFRILANQINEDFYVLCLYQEKETMIQKNDKNHPLLKPVPWIQQKFMRFNPVITVEPIQCLEPTRPFRKNY